MINLLKLPEMSTSLDDITIYYNGTAIKDAPEDWDFRRTVNFVCDFYHQMLFGYKPPKASRICIHVGGEKKYTEPTYFGSIVMASGSLDEHKYLRLGKLDQWRYILDIVHGICLELCLLFNWETAPFEEAYHQVIDRQFVFQIAYPFKRSRDKVTQARIVVDKTMYTSILSVEWIRDGITKKVQLLNKRNWFWTDSVYELAKNARWLDASTFGVASKVSSRFGYYSIEDDVIIGDLHFEEMDN